MTRYEVDLRVEYRRRVWVDAPDEDAACEEVVEREALRIGGISSDIEVYGLRVVTKAEMEDA